MRTLIAILALVGCTRKATITSVADECLTIAGEAGPWAGSVWLDDWYAVEQLDCQTYILAEPRSFEYNVSYLVMGSERAVLFDTGAGGRSMSEAVAMLTALPVAVVLSHFHYDHVGNLDEFDPFAFIDLPCLRARTDSSGTFTFESDEVLADTPKTVQVAQWWADGEVVDLGGRSVSLASIPGHTPESVALLDHDVGYLFTGDFLYNGELYAMLPGSDVSDYGASASRLVAETTPDYRVFGAHGVPENAYGRLTALESLVGCVEDGSCTPVSQTLFGQPVYAWSQGGVTLLTERE